MLETPFVEKRLGGTERKRQNPTLAGVISMASHPVYPAIGAEFPFWLVTRSDNRSRDQVDVILIIPPPQLVTKSLLIRLLLQ